MKIISPYRYFWNHLLPLVIKLTYRRPSKPCSTERSALVDVGAHIGESTLITAWRRKDIIVFAFEPNIGVASHLFGLMDNYIIMPMAVSETDGFIEMFLNDRDETSSTLQLNEEGLRRWKSRKPIKRKSVVTVPSIRLDTFMEMMGIKSIEYLKVDTQGGDLSVVKSAGDRLQDIEQVRLEVQITDIPLYEGAPSKDSIVEYMNTKGFELFEARKQSFGQEENLLFRKRDRQDQRHRS